MDPHQLDELILKIGMLILDARLADGSTSNGGSGSGGSGAGGGAGGGDGGSGGPLTPTSHDRQFVPFGSVPTVAADAWRSELDRAHVRSRLDGWKNATPVYVDVGHRALGETPRLCERWCLTYEPLPLPTETTADGAHQVDHTNVVLLLQSLYARVRQLPLGNDLAGQVVLRDALSYRIWTAEDTVGRMDGAFGPPRTPGATVARHSFASAELADGRLQLHVEFESKARPGPARPGPATPPVAQAMAPASTPADLDTPTKPVPTKRVTPVRRGLSPMEPGSPRPPPLPNRESDISDGFRLDQPGLPIPAGSPARRNSDMQRDTVYRASPRPSPSWSPHLGGSRSWTGSEKHAAASLVGSYEESLLTGRMSALPAPAIDFEAELGVYGQGHCKPALKCPPHVHVPCPATYYQLPHEQPSPYVGVVTLPTLPDGSAGRYRLPAQGVVQLIVRNPNKTVVKVFVVPYNLHDMPAQTRTFLRQSSYSDEQPSGMRFAIHLPLVCLRKGHHYVSGPIRVVFCHWMQDGASKLRVVAAEPTPRYTAFAPDDGGSTADAPERAPSPPPVAAPAPIFPRSSPTKEWPLPDLNGRAAPPLAAPTPSHTVAVGFAAATVMEPTALSPRRTVGGFPVPSAPNAFLVARGLGSPEPSDPGPSPPPPFSPTW